MRFPAAVPFVHWSSKHLQQFSMPVVTAKPYARSSATGRGWYLEQRKPLPGLEEAHEEATRSASVRERRRSSLPKMLSCPVARESRRLAFQPQAGLQLCAVRV